MRGIQVKILFNPSSVISYDVCKAQKSSVWDYFEFDEVENKSTCIVVVGNGQNQPANEPAKTCGIKIAGKYPTNLRKHLEKFHKKEHQDMETKEKEKKEEAKKQVSYP